jgi:hypothetical protein
MTAPTYQPEVLETYSEPAPEQTPRVAGRLSSGFRPLSPVPTYAGIAVVAVGLLLIGAAWSQVAGEANVARQIPYLVSGGIFGLALVLIGALVINVASKRRETALRERQARLLSDAVRELGRTLDGLAVEADGYSRR